MGIFEKSIPKYVIDPIERNVQVAPQPYVVDDIFDPVLNANVRNALRQKYGSSLAGIGGGYAELLENAWGGDTGIFGKGMGVLSTFGRSMEKADDIVLGLLTEGVEGISGQGFDNPFEEIFVNDVDYTGKRLLASTANIGRNIVGTTVAENDFGDAWNLPALGLELGTDVGILGGSLARKFAPSAKDFTSKQLFERLGKSGLKTTVGEVGQLMSNYDDLMAKVAIDVTAPGLRPAFKALKGKLDQLFQVMSPEGYANFKINLDTIEDDTLPPEIRKKAQTDLANDPITQQSLPLFKEADDKLATLPDDTAYEVFEGGAEENAIDRAAAALQRDIDAEEFAKRTYSKKMADLEAKILKSRVKQNRSLSKSFEKAMREAEARGYKTNYEKLLEAKDPDVAYNTLSEALPEVRKLIDLSNPDHINVEYIEPVRKLVEDAEAGRPEGFLDAMRTGTWTPNDAANKSIMKHVYQYVPYAKKAYSPYRVSPSLRSSVNASGAPGVSYATSALRKIIRQDVKSGKMLFNNAEEFSKFFNSPKMTKNLEKFIPAMPLSAHDAAKYSSEDAAKKSAMYARLNRQKFKKLLSEVYFPPKGISDYDYTKKLIDLEDFLTRYASPDAVVSKNTDLEALSSRQLEKFAQHPEQVVPLEKFLENNKLLTLDESGDILDVDPAAYYALSHAYPDLLKYPGKYSMVPSFDKDTAAKAERILLAYRAELRNILNNIPKRTKRNKSFLDVLYNTVEDISMKYLQPLRDETPRKLKNIANPLSVDKTLSSESTTTFLDTLQDTETIGQSAMPVIPAHRAKTRLDDESSLAYSRAVRDWFDATVPPDADVRDVIAIAKPFANILDIGYKAGVKVPVRPKVAKDVKTFYKDVVPLIEQLTSNPTYGNYYLSQVFTSKDAVAKIAKKDASAAEDIKKLRNLVGAPLADTKHSKSEVFRKLYNEVVKKHDVAALKFEPKHGGRELEALRKYFSTPRTPSEIFKTMGPRLEKAHFEAFYNSQSTQNLDTLATRFYNNFFSSLDDLGTTEDEITEIITQARAKGTASLNTDQLRKYRAYVQEISKVLSQTPYRAYTRNAAHWNSSTSWLGITETLASLYPLQYGLKGTPIVPKIRQRVDDLVTRELAQGLDSTRKIPFEYSDDDVSFLEKYVIPKLPENVKGYWNPSHDRGLLYFDIPSFDEAYTFQLGTDVDMRPERFQIERFLKSFKGNLDDLNDIRTLDYGTLYSKSGREHLTDVASRLDLRMNLIPEKEANFADVFEEAFNKYTPTTKKSATKAVESVKNAIVEQPTEAVAKQAYEPPDMSFEAAEKALKTALGEDAYNFIKDGGDPEAFKELHGERKWELYEQIQKARNVPTKNAIRAERASLRTKITEALGNAFTAITEKERPDTFQRYYKLRTAITGDVVKGSDFWTTFRRTGILVAPYVKGSGMIDATAAALTKNAKLLNETLGKDVADVVTYTLDNGNVAVVMRWTGDKNTALLVKKAQNSLNSAKFDDVVFTKARELTTEERAFMESATMKELTGLMEQLQAQAADQATYLGFKFDDTPYTKHAMRHDHHVALWLDTNVYNRGVSSDDYDAIASAISGLDGYRQMDRGTFGTLLQDRRFRGDYWLLDNKQHPLFEYTPDKVFTSTLADGVFANLQYQSFVDLFINETYKIKGWFKSVDDLKKVLYAKLDGGKMSGNLQNLELVSYKTDANGKITGLIKYDKMSDEGLAKALKDENTILVPANAVSHMDNILRKDIRASNKFWTFINKHFTIPFKFGLLSNPGFLLGNVGDAYFKLATTMSQKYGTSFAAEAKGVAESINTVIHLKNTYSEVFQEWLKVVDENSLNIADEARIPEIVAMTPKYKDMFLQWLNGDLKVKARNPATKKLEDVTISNSLAKSQIDEARVYMMLQSMQMNSNKLREYADLAGLAPTSDFDVPANMWDRVTQGKGSYRWNKPSTWGLFMNNPIMKAFTDASGGWEELIRTASIVDDLKHKAYSVEDLSEYSKYLSPDPEESRRLFDVHLEEAKNTMYNAQFDYERVNNFFDSIGKAVPFPIFFLKNFQYWMDVFMRNPQFVDNVIDVQEGLWAGHNEKDDKFMKEAKGRGAIPIQGDALPEWFKGVYKPSPLQSMFGAFNLLNSPLDNLTYRVNPLISGTVSAVGQATGDPLTTLSDPESIKYRPYSTDMYERNVKLGDENFNPVNYTLHRMNPFDRTMNAWLRAPGKMEEGEFQLSDALPSVFQPIF